MSDCATCRFRLIISGHRFQCAADQRGWAYVWDNERHPTDCKKHVAGPGKRIGHELASGEFWRVSGRHIREKDWAHWKAIGAA